MAGEEVEKGRLVADRLLTVFPWESNYGLWPRQTDRQTDGTTLSVDFVPEVFLANGHHAADSRLLGSNQLKPLNPINYTRPLCMLGNILKSSRPRRE